MVFCQLILQQVLLGFGSLLQQHAVDLLPVFDFQLYCSRDDVAESESRRGFYLSSGKVGILAKEKKKPGRKEGRKGGMIGSVDGQVFIRFL